jgi:hypothetical protein
MFPSCSSCAARKITCQYVDHALPNLALLPDGTSISSLQVPGNNNLIRLDGVDPCAQDVGSNSDMDFDFNIFNTGALEHLDRPEILVPCAHNFNLTSLESDILPVIQTERFYRPVSPISLQWKPPKILDRRSLDTPQAQMATMMLGQIIASFPHMMTRQDTFPPFIHPRCYDYSSGSNDLPEILKDCMGLAHMFHTKTRESNKMFWRSVRIEQEKLYAQVCSAQSLASSWLTK